MENDFYIIDSCPDTYTHKITMIGSVEYNREYRDLYTYLSTLPKGDTVELYLGSDGGSVEVCSMLVNSIRKSKAKTNITMLMPCYSAAAILALSGDSLTMEDNTFLMFHNQSCGYEGKHNASLSYMEANEKQYSQLLERVCYPFLTKQEIKQVLNDKDLYIHADGLSLQKRLNRHFGGKYDERT